MRKHIISGLVGFMLATAAGANAEGVTNLIDQVVQGVFPVTVEGNSVGDAIVVDNKTYLPVREFGEAVGYKVTFTEDREVVLTKTANLPGSTTTIPGGTVITPSVPSVSVADLKKKILDEQESIEHAKSQIKVNQDSLSNPRIPKDSVQQAIDMYNKQISDAEKRIAEYEAQITALEAQK